MLLELISWLFFGLIVGFIANLIDPSPNTGWLGNIAVGITGAVIAGFITNLLNLKPVDNSFNFYSLGLSIIGSLVVLFIYRTLMKRQS